MSDDQQILLRLCQVLRELVFCQEEANRSSRALYSALRTHFPEMDKEVADHRKDADFASVLSARLAKVSLELEALLESLKRS